MQVRVRRKPTAVGYTNDLDIWLNNVARIACMGGATEEDVAQIAFDTEHLRERSDFTRS